jgi:hypothetical protein
MYPHAQSNLGVTDVQLSLTSLEEVFIKIARKAEMEQGVSATYTLPDGTVMVVSVTLSSPSMHIGMLAHGVRCTIMALSVSDGRQLWHSSNGAVFKPCRLHYPYTYAHLLIRN